MPSKVQVTQPREMQYGLGDTVQDSVTNFVGVIVCRAQWLNGCNRYGVQSTKLKGGLPSELQHFDEAQLTLVKSQAVKQTKVKITGGPRPDARRTDNVH